jgi:hypothetical protein
VNVKDNVDAVLLDSVIRDGSEKASLVATIKLGPWNRDPSIISSGHSDDVDPSCSDSIDILGRDIRAVSLL